MYETQTIYHARRLWDFYNSFSTHGTSDAIVVCCSYDFRVCDFACDLYKQGAAESIVFSGNTGNWTSKLWAKEEAYIFQEIALANGVPKSKIITEPVATNLGENLSLSRALLPDVDSVTFVTKPNTLLRVKLTKEVKWNQIKAK